MPHGIHPLKDIIIVIVLTAAKITNIILFVMVITLMIITVVNENA